MKRLLLIVALLLPVRAYAAIAFVQAANNGTAGATATSIAATVSALGAGNFVAGIVTYGSATVGDLTNCTDGTTTATIPATTQISDSGDGQSASGFYIMNVTGGATTITCNFGSALAYRGISVQEFSGVATTSALDGTNLAGVLATCTACTSGTSKTPSANNYLVFVGSANTGNTGGGGSEFTAGTNFIEPVGAEHSISNDISLSSEYWIQTTATATNGPITATQNTPHATIMLDFVVSGGAPASTCKGRMLMGLSGC